MASKGKETKLTPQQEQAALKLKTGILEDELHSARGLNQQTIVESARARSRIRHMEDNLKEKTKDLDLQISQLEWQVEEAGQTRAKLNAQISSAEANLKTTIESYSQQIKQKKSELAEQEALLKSELQMYQTELESLREFQSQRAQMEEELHHLDQTLVKQRQVHQETMEQFETQLKREAEIYERENARKVREAEQAAVNMKDECLKSAAIRCIQESQAVAANLKRNQIKSKDILSANNELINTIEKLKRDNQLLTEREEMLVNDVSKYKQKIEALKLKLSEDEVSYAKSRAQIETESASKIEALTRECQELEKENDDIQKHINFLKQKTSEIEAQKKAYSTKQTQLMKLLTGTAPLVMESLKSHSENEEQSPLQALIGKLEQAVAAEEAAEQKEELANPILFSNSSVQTQNPKISNFVESN